MYLISNTNELNVTKILELFKKDFPDIAWEKNIDLSVELTNQPIKIAPNIFLCLSYKYGLFKTDGLLKKVVDEQGYGQLQELKVVSQFTPDLDKAKEIGIPESNLYSSEKFYKSSQLLHKIR